MLRLILFVLLSLLAVYTALSQNWEFPMSAEGDTLMSDINVPDSIYSPNVIIFRFKEASLKRSTLCESWNIYRPSGGKGGGIASTGMDSSFKAYLLNEQLPLTSVIDDTALTNYLASKGGAYFRRLTAASPCYDTLSTTRSGDTIRVYDHCFYALHLNNDTSVTTVLLNVALFYRQSLWYAQPSFEFSGAAIPNDPQYNLQRSLHDNLTNVEYMWNFFVGRNSTKVAVIDDGINYTHCEFGPNGEGNWGDKVYDGFNYRNAGTKVSFLALHGTPVASIVGALTNRFTCGTDLPDGVAGIAGGWGRQGGAIDLGQGARLLALKVGDYGTSNTEAATAAVLDAANDRSKFNPEHPDYGVDIIQFGLATETDYQNADPTIQEALNTAYENGLPFVCPTGNKNHNRGTYPWILSDQKTIAIGASDLEGDRADYSNYGSNLDLIAPGGFATGDNRSLNRTANIVSTPNPLWQWFDGTSAAAPNATGVIAAVYEQLTVSKSDGQPTKMVPEDYEGVLNASARDRTPNTLPLSQEKSDYLVGYDGKTGYGLLDAGRLTEMVVNDRYELVHYEVYANTDSDYLDEGNWSANWTQRLFPETPGTARNNFTPGFYNTKFRRLDLTFDIPSGWDREYPLYVWGRGRQQKNGVDLSNPNYLQGYTNSDFSYQEGGNGITAGIVVPENNDDLKFFTFQFDLYNNVGQHIGQFPPNNSIRFSFTLFGRRTLTYIAGGEEYYAANRMKVHPNPVTNGRVIVGLPVTYIGGVLVDVISSSGELLKQVELSQEDSGRISIDVSGYPIGVYFIRTIVDGKLYQSSLTVLR
jgi:hypothetical protein